MSDQAIKFDTGKPQISCFPLNALNEAIKVMTLGAKKYGKYNYISGTGLDHSRMFDAAIRHIFQYWNQDHENDIDELGTHHLANAIAELSMLLEHILKQRGLDDRPKK